MRQLLLIILVAFPMSSMAISGLGPGAVPVQVQTPSVRSVGLASFEEALGGRLSAEEARLFSEAYNKYDEIQNAPTPVAWKVGSVQWAPVMCLSMRLDLINFFSTQAVKEILRKLNLPTGGGGEIQPCYDFSTGNIVVLAGASGVYGAGPGILQIGGQFGLYFGPSHLNKPMIGDYYFVRVAKTTAVVKFQGTVAFDKDRCILSELRQFKTGDCQMMVFAGAGLDIWSGIKFWRSPVATPDAAAPASSPSGLLGRALQAVSGLELTVGQLWTVSEIPYAEWTRLVREHAKAVRARKLAGNN